jgi:hypothetical protein
MPHVITSPHELGPMHCTSHDVAIWHCTLCMHEWSPHTTRHGRFVGHTTSPESHALPALQSITHTPCESQVPFEQPCWHSATAPPESGLASAAASLLLAPSAAASTCISRAGHRPR